MTYSLVLVTLLSVPGGSSTVSSATLQRHLSLDECLAQTQAYRPLSDILPTGQRLTLNLTCEKA